MSTTCNVKPGVCNMDAKIVAALGEDMMSVDVTIETKCPMIQKMSPITGINAYSEVGTPMAESVIYQKATECIRHTACPIPCAIVKCVEVESGMAIKRPVTIEFE